ncbi:heavy metal transporter [Actinomadura meridiana]|uniref:Heavy metal transporter n=2 Tax=Actinomadura meridiana TaxID=559626 RepID=A0ABP8CM65_9ACTN
MKARPEQGRDGGRHPGRWWAAGVSVVVLLLGVGAYALFQRARPYLHGTGCEVSTSTGKMPLDLEQAANAATIAAVAFHRRLPDRAAVIAYATAIQESHIRNLPGGDRDSVGMFQQRPSQGWGKPQELRDPVKSTEKFFKALVKVKGYLDRDLHDAAQRVQRSADGTAYARHEDDGELLATAFTGREPAAARCWYPPGKRITSRRPDALRELRRAFGTKLTISGPAPLGEKTPSTPDSWNAVKAPNPRTGWSIASWAVTHAQTYGLTEIRYAGRHWQSTAGHDGWTEDKQAPTTSVIIR